MSEQNPAGPSSASLWTTAALAGACLFASCGGGGGSTPKTASARSTGQSIVIGTTVAAAERWIAYLADESTTTDTATMMLADFNGDMDSLDLVPHFVNMATRAETNVGVAADDFAFVYTPANGAHLFMVVDEAKDGGTDWNMMNGAVDTVLLHYNVSLDVGPTLVATLDTTVAPTLVTVDDRVYYADVPPVALVNGETNLSFVSTAAPTAPTRVLDSDNSMPHTLQLLGQDEGLIFAYQDETPLAMVDLNGDMDFTDTHVLSLLDGTAPGASSQSVGLAMVDAMVPYRALSTGANDWVVGFLVDETAQGATNLNALAIPEFGAAWQPAQCDTFDDMDSLDQVLHYLSFAAWFADPMMDPPVNTGLVGTDRIVAVTSNMSEYVGTISAEADEGTCDLNGDGMTDDDVLRWVKVDTVVRPFGDVNQLLSLERVGGGIQGVSDLDGRFICVVDEADDGRDHDGDMMMDRTLVAWLDPDDGNAAVWDFDHCKAAVPSCAGIDSVGSQWMGERVERDRLLSGFEESVFGASINDPAFRAKGGDLDTLDSVPTFAFFAAGPELDFAGPRIAVDADNAGIGIYEGRAYYRVDEADDNTDWNGDMDTTDFVLFRTTVATIGSSFYVGTLNSAVRPAIEAGNDIGVAFIADEVAETRDFNQDGDTNDTVLRWLRL